ncbi:MULTISPECIES: hypothetical protein [Leptospira]|nr:hypothetical protein DPV73_14050 [Leptospira mayottensis]
MKLRFPLFLFRYYFRHQSL